MEQLLSIKSVPMKYEMTVSHARLEYNSQQSQVQQSRVPGGLQISNRPAKLQLDTSAARNSVSPTPAVSVKQAAQKGLQAAKDATAQYAREGRQLTEAGIGDNTIGQIVAQRTAPATGEFQLGFIPSVGPDIKYVEPDFEMRYQADKLQFDVRVAKGDLKYVPGSISMNITQWPDVVIEYMGKPLYVPPSAAEKFEASA